MLSDSKGYGLRLWYPVWILALLASGMVAEAPKWTLPTESLLMEPSTDC